MMEVNQTDYGKTIFERITIQVTREKLTEKLYKDLWIMKIIDLLKAVSISFFIIAGTLCLFTGQSIASETLQPVGLQNGSILPENQKPLVLAQRDCMKGDETHCQGAGSMGCGKGGMGRHGGAGCQGMGKGMGPQGGMGHHHGMGHGRMYGGGPGPGLDGKAQCPQERATTKAPDAIYNQNNPLQNSSENIEKGRLLFQLNVQPSCTACHGSGDGLGMMSGSLTPPPRNFTCGETMREIPDGQLFWIIQNGSPGTGMPAFDNLVDEEIWSLILFLRSLTS
ncbi:MAG: c-type cytochrome [Nitrospinales bacterium]